MTNDLWDKLDSITAKAVDEASIYRPGEGEIGERPPYVDFSAKVRLEPTLRHWENKKGEQGDTEIVRLHFTEMLVHKLGNGREPFYETEAAYDITIPSERGLQNSELGRTVASIREFTGDSNATIRALDGKLVHFVEQGKAPSRIPATSKPQVVKLENGETRTAYPGEVRLDRNGYRQRAQFWWRVVNIEGLDGAAAAPTAAKVGFGDMPNKEIAGFATGLSQAEFYASVAKQDFCKSLNADQMAYLISDWLSEAQAQGLLSTSNGVFTLNN